MIPSPNLDDRRYDDIVDEAIRLIPQYCPDWTNFNKADPGITLVHLFAWMTELVIYRLNKVPEKNYLSFLDMMGIQRQPPQPARTVLTFTISEKADSTLVPAGTQIATHPTGDRKETLFETETDLTVVNNKLSRVVSQYHDQYADITSYLETNEAFEVFEGVRSVDRYLYIGDDRLENFSEAAILTLTIEVANPGERPFPKMMEWEYWNGERWRELNEAGIDTDPDSIAFAGPGNHEKCVVGEVETFWIRGRLAEVPKSYDETEVHKLTGRIEVLGDGIDPELMYFSPAPDAYLILDSDRNFKLFGDEPHIDTFLYIASDEIFRQPKTRVKVEVMLTDPSIVEKPAPSADLVLEWQYYNGKRWRTLGKMGPGYEPPKGKSKADENPYDFKDETVAFSQNGALSFNRPEDMQAVEVNGHEQLWIRCQVIKGGYGAKGTYELVEDRWVYQNEFPLKPPSLKALTLKFAEEKQGFGQVWTYNDFMYVDESKMAATQKPFRAFQPVPEENPTLYLGFDNPFPHEPIQIFFNVVDPTTVVRGRRRAKVFVGSEEQDKYVEQTIVWEYWNGKEWAPLLPKDGTDNFQAAGFLEFVGPKVHRKARRYGDNLHWIRARLAFGGYDEPPICDGIRLNTVYASNYQTIPEFVLGASQGTPNQFFGFTRGQLLPGQHIAVIEQEKPSDDDLERLIAEEGPDAIRELPEHGGWLVRWHEVESFYESLPRSRHYMKEVSNGEIRFGDGVRGMVPPKGERNIVAVRCRVGGGFEGNVPAGAIEVLQSTIPFIETVTNPYAAMGGADLETIDEIKLRGPHVLKSTGRAVTREDFEWLAVQSSNSVARVNCIPAHKSEGQVTVVVVPKMAENHPDFVRSKALPSTELLRRVRQYLGERKLLTTVLHVVKPRYREFSAKIEIMRRTSGSSDRIKREIDERLRRFLHPLRGGKQRRGWPFGRNVFKVDLFHVVEEVDGVDFVSAVRIIDEDTKSDVDQVRIDEDELPFLVNIDITEKAHERIL